MLTPEQYETLRPHIGAIKQTADTKCSVSSTPWEAMANVNSQMGQPPVDGYCPACALRLYEDMARLIREYENFVSTASATETC